MVAFQWLRICWIPPQQATGLNLMTSEPRTSPYRPRLVSASRFDALLRIFRIFPRNLEPEVTHYLCEKKRKTEIYENEKKPCSFKINSDPYAKRTISRVAATPARQGDRISRAWRTPPTNAFLLVERAHLAVGACSRRQLWPTIPPGLLQARNHVSPNPHLRRASATDSRRPAAPTSRLGAAKWRVPHL